jgi:membrane protein YqaA with SNARE-associated domain
LFLAFAKLGGVGLLGLGVLDSSFFFAPFGNDLLLVALTAREHSVALMLYYAGASSLGSALGCLVVDLLVRPAGEKGLERRLSKRRIERLTDAVKRKGGLALVVAALAPPPFPFTAFVMAAAALQYPRVRLATVIGAARLVRYAILGALALRFGPHILRWFESRAVELCLLGLVAVSVVGSGVSAYRWIKPARRAA